MLNLAVIMGRLVTTPELKHTQDGIAHTTFSLAVDRSFKKEGEDRQADFIDVSAWRGTAEFVCKYFKKGELVAVQGEIRTRTYTDKDGNRRKAFEIAAEQIHFAGGKQD